MAFSRLRAVFGNVAQCATIVAWDAGRIQEDLSNQIHYRYHSVLI